MLNSSDIYNALNVSSVTSLLSAYKTGKALFSASLMPSDCTASSSVNFYLITPIDCALEYDLEYYSASCRAKTEGQSIALARAVIDAINLKTTSNYNIICKLNRTIPPADSTDNFNTPVEIRLKKKR